MIIDYHNAVLSFSSVCNCSRLQQSGMELGFQSHQLVYMYACSHLTDKTDEDVLTKLDR